MPANYKSKWTMKTRKERISKCFAIFVIVGSMIALLNAWTTVGISSILNAWVKPLRQTFWPILSHSSAPTLIVLRKLLRVTSGESSARISLKNIKIILLKPMHKAMDSQCIFYFYIGPGAQQPTADTCSSTKKEIKKDLSAYNARKIIVWTVELSGIQIWHVNNTRCQAQCLRMTRSF